MSFQDFGGGSSRRQVGTTTATAKTTTAASSSSATGVTSRPGSAPRSGGILSSSHVGSGNSSTSASAAPSSDSFLKQISDSLLQYQRNVGILEKIVQSLAARTNMNQRIILTDPSELELQYNAQVDVISQLQGKVQALFDQAKRLKSTSTLSSTTTALSKLEKDFDRVKSRATALQEMQKRNKQQKQQQQVGSRVDQDEQQYQQQQQQQQQQQDHYQRMQMQLEEDRLNEQIMREREEEIRNINRGMHQVNEIYKDLAHIVGSQQEQIDTIETQMEDSRANAESGLKQVQKANEHFGNSQCAIS